MAARKAKAKAKRRCVPDPYAPQPISIMGGGTSKAAAAAKCAQASYNTYRATRSRPRRRPMPR